MAKKKANAKQYPELLLLVNYSHFSSSLSFKNNRAYFKKEAKEHYVCFHEIIRVIIMKMKIKMKNRSHRYDINRPMDTNILNIKSVSVMMVLLCNKNT